MNKGEAERCRDIGAEALRSGQYQRAVKFFGKSLKLYPLAGVSVLLNQAENKLKSSGNGEARSSSNGATANHNTFRRSSTASSAAGNPNSNFQSSSSAVTARASPDGRSYTEDQVSLVKKVLRAKEGGSGA